LPSAVLEAELFGHVKGAFTGATEARVGLLSHANGGTLFLDEIGDMPLDLQPKLLRVLQQRSVRPIGSYQEIPFDARVIAATNRDLGTRVASGEFREDLYYRLNIISIHVPPLRERAEDITLLIQHFLQFLSASGDGTCEFDEAAEAVLSGYHWPGNVRELENCVRAAVAMARNGKVGVDELPLALSKGAALPTYTDKVSLEEIERRHIALVLRTFNWNKALVARKLGIDRTTLYRKMKRYGLESRPR
jgi:DNA-binding NtrC family response regulator